MYYSLILELIYASKFTLFLGKRRAESYGLLPKKGSTYNPKVDPSIINSFATSAYRFGHSMIQGENIKVL